ncbi:hypothetical protein BH09PAT4_BH09PAT4_02320 [soil metagenome]
MYMKNFSSDLKEVLIFAAQNGYASEDVEKNAEPNGSVSIRLQRGDWLVHDNYFTSEDGRCYYGSVVAYLADKAMWFCGYSGFVDEGGDPNEIYAFLKKAMLLPDPDFPVRGPWDFTDGIWGYHYEKTDPSSTLERFETRETITQDGRQVYEGVFYGGGLT